MSLLAERERRKAEHVLERDYLAMREEVLRSVRSVLHRMSVPYHEDELQWFYNTAWWSFYEKLRDGAVTELDKHNPAGFLVTAATRRAIDAVRRAPVRGRVDVIDVEDRGSEPDFADMMDNRHLLRQFTQGLREQLTERECQMATLCWIDGHTRPEAARILGLPEERAQKIMDAATPKIFALIETIKRGGWCEEHQSMMRAFARDWLDHDGQRYKLAKDHLEDCPACRRFVREALCIVLPPVFIPIHGAASSSATWHALNRGVHAAWRHHIHKIGPHVILGHSTAAVGAGAAAGGVAGGTGLLAGPGAKLGAGLAVLALGGAAIVGAPPVLHENTHHAATHRQPAVVASRTGPTSVTTPAQLVATHFSSTRAARSQARRQSTRSHGTRSAREHRGRRHRTPSPAHTANAEFTPETGTSTSTTSTAPPPTQAPTPSSSAPVPVTHPSTSKRSTTSSAGQGCEFTFEQAGAHC
jgi:DNA-directed RNA polymerase specialized sigma24 family protein